MGLLPARSPAGALGAAPGAAPGAPAKPTLSPAENLARASKGLQSDGAYAQGFHGDLVKHEDKKTLAEDWGTEYGAGSKTLQQICQANPANVWCSQHGHNFGYNNGVANFGPTPHQINQALNR